MFAVARSTTVGEPWLPVWVLWRYGVDESSFFAALW